MGTKKTDAYVFTAYASVVYQLMTMSATAIATAFTVAFVVAATASTAAAVATASVSAHLVDEVLYFLLSSSTHLANCSFENQIFSSVRVIKVDDYLIFCNFAYVTKEMMTIGILQRNNITSKYVF